MNHRLALSALVAGLLVAPVVHAGPADTVYTPNVEKGELELEFRGGVRDFGAGPSEHAFIYEIGYGFTNNWYSALVLEYAAEGGEQGKLEAWEWENVIALTEQGKYWADLGLFAEYEHGFSAGPDEIKIGPMFQKEIGPTVANLNLLFEREVGSGASNDVGMGYTWQVKWRGAETHEFGLQGLGELGKIGHLGQDVEHSVGPAFFGTRRLASGNKFTYDAAVLAGVTKAAPDWTARVQFEYEIY